MAQLGALPLEALFLPPNGFFFLPWLLPTIDTQFGADP